MRKQETRTPLIEDGKEKSQVFKSSLKRLRILPTGTL